MDRCIMKLTHEEIQVIMEYREQEQIRRVQRILAHMTEEKHKEQRKPPGHHNQREELEWQ